MNASRKATKWRDRDARCDRPQNDRISKLLLSEYCEFFETILVESPFAETTRNGRGIRQVALGLTPTRLVVAADVLQTNPGFFCPPDIDVSIESFELVSVYPLEYVTLSVFRRRRRRSLKARVFWKIWCEQVQRLLACKMDGSSLSETTAASSSSSGTLYLLSSEIEIEADRDTRWKKPVFRIWKHYGGAGDYVVPTWTEKDLYLGPPFSELTNGHYTPVPIRFAGASLEDVRYELEDHTPHYIACRKSCHSWPCQTKFGSQAKSQRVGGLCNVLFARNRNAHRRDYIASRRSSSCDICQLDDSVGINIVGERSGRHESRNMLSEEEFRDHVGRNGSFLWGGEYGRRQQQQEDSKTSLASKVSRFGFGVPEKCHSGLILGPYRGDSSRINVPELRRSSVDPHELIESGVTVWEGSGEDRRASSRSRRHPRRYAFSSAAHFLHALGPWSVQPGERDSVQTLRSLSTVNIRRQPSDPELRLPVSRRQLTASVSCAALTSNGSSIVSTVTRGRVILFWTPEYWYRPQAAAIAYRELRRHLASLRDFRREKEKPTKRKFLCKRRGQRSAEGGSLESTVTTKPSGLLERVFSMSGARKRDKSANENNADVDKSTAQLRRLLRTNLRITVWDVDSATLATQLTMIDRDLFVRIPATEIEVLIHQRSTRNAPNLGAWVAFSHRMACLTVSEILAIKKLDMRGRIMARFINVADKCFALGNFQSCRSILAGLQAPPIYRLRRSWSYLRIRHASRYETMEKLSKIYKNPRCSKYQRAWTAAERDPPYMPYVGHFLIKALGLNVAREIQADFPSSAARKSSIVHLIGTSRSLPLNGNTNDCRSRGEQDSMEPRQGLARRLLAATLARMKFTTRRNIGNEIESNLWTCRQRHLARKYFHRWNAIALESKTRAENERRSKNVDSKRRRVLDVAVWLTDCQRFAQGYNFPLHSFACEFLLKARYREDRENFFISLKLEPPKAT